MRRNVSGTIMYYIVQCIPYTGIINFYAYQHKLIVTFLNKVGIVQFCNWFRLQNLEFDHIEYRLLCANFRRSKYID